MAEAKKIKAYEIGELDHYLFGQGNHYEIYKKLGSHKVKDGDTEGVYFAVWAPNAKAVSVEVDYSDDAVVYDSTDGYRDYMIVLTGLTKDGKAGDLKATEMSAAMFVELSDGSVVYSDVFATSYNAVEQVYADNGIAAGIDY